jgi:hypothetical protein
MMGHPLELEELFGEVLDELRALRRRPMRANHPSMFDRSFDDSREQLLDAMYDATPGPAVDEAMVDAANLTDIRSSRMTGGAA